MSAATETSMERPECAPPEENADFLALTEDQRCQKWMPWTRSLVAKMKQRLGHGVDYDDLLSDASLGLLNAVRRYCPSHHVKFSSYARHRIVGAMLDGLRQRDWLPRSVRERIRKADIDQEHAARMDEVKFVSFSELHADEALDRHDPFEEVAAMDLAENILQSLPARDANFLHMYFWENKTLREIGQMLGVGESRCSQLKSEVLQRVHLNRGEDGLHEDVEVQVSAA